MMVLASSNASRQLPPYTSSSITACKHPQFTAVLLFVLVVLILCCFSISWPTIYPICSVDFRVVYVFSVAFHVLN